MLDYINWYLVELDRALRDKRTALNRAELLLETRAHLEAGVEDLVSKGVDRATAERAALIDFGDPRTVADGFLGRGSISRKAFWGWIVAASAFCLTLPITLAILILDPGAVSQSAFLGSGFWLPAIGCAIGLFVAIKRRTWSLAIIGAASCLGAILISTYAAGRTQLFEVDGETRFVTKSKRLAQIRARETWLAKYEIDMPKLAAWRANRSNDRLLKELCEVGGRYAVPVRWGGDSPDLEPSLPSETVGAQTMARYSDRHRRTFRIMFDWGDNFGAAKQIWLENADAYAAYLKGMRKDVAAELEGLRHVRRSGISERWTMLGWPIAALTGFFALCATLVNGLVVLLLDATRLRRRGVWRKQVG